MDEKGLEEPIVEEPDNPEDILVAEISNVIETKGEIPEEKKKQLFQLRCEKYSKVKKQIDYSDEGYKKRIAHLEEPLKKLLEEKDKIYNEHFKPQLEVYHSEKDRLKGLIEDTFPDEKTVKFEGIGRFTRKILKSIEVVDKDKLLAALVEKKMLSKGVKSFDINFLKKSKELELFSDEEVREIEKASLLFVEEKAKENHKL